MNVVSQNRLKVSYRYYLLIKTSRYHVKHSIRIIAEIRKDYTAPASPNCSRDLLYKFRPLTCRLLQQ